MITVEYKTENQIKFKEYDLRFNINNITCVLSDLEAATDFIAKPYEIIGIYNKSIKDLIIKEIPVKTKFTVKDLIEKIQKDQIDEEKKRLPKTPFYFGINCYNGENI